MTTLNKEVDVLSTKCDNILIIGDFNSEPFEKHMSDFCTLYDACHLEKPKCFKNPEKSTCIDLMITNKPKGFFKARLIDSYRSVGFPLNDYSNSKINFSKETSKSHTLSMLQIFL